MAGFKKLDPNHGLRATRFERSLHDTGWAAYLFSSAAALAVCLGAVFAETAWRILRRMF